MTDPDLRLIAVLCDRSGSMLAGADDLSAGLDAFLAAHRAAAGTTVVTLARFDDVYELLYRHRPIADVPVLQLRPRGRTALLDAIGRFVTDVGESLAALPEHQRPGAVSVLVISDGHDNASGEWTKDAVRQLIAQQQDTYNWDCVFLGTQEGAVEVGTELGFAQWLSCQGDGFDSVPAPGQA